ncbi:MAG: 23S rRNA (uracil(1939)-C(5))-methyltransferase RlmD [Bacillota bacterium]
MAEKVLPVKKGERIDLEITGVTHSGEGVGRYMGAAVFVPGAVPGEKVRAEVAEIKKSFAVARLLEITGPSPARRDPRCVIFNSCGGCRLQHVDYREQLKIKTGLVRDSLQRIGGLGQVTVKETAGMDDPWHYRNKVHYQVAETGGGLALGFYEEGSRRLTPFPVAGAGKDRGCLLVDRDLNQAASQVERLINIYTGPAGGKGTEGRFFRHVVLRKGLFTGEIMAVIVTSGTKWPREGEFVRGLMSVLPGITSLVRNINDGPAGPVLGGENRLLAGREYITDRLDQLEFIISPASFYQVNPLQTRVLYRKALEYAFPGHGRGGPVVDAYSGIGTIALYLAGRAGQVHAVEVVPAAIEDARRNASLNSVKNVRFHKGEAERILPALAAGGLRPDVVVLDPPRRGCGREALEAVSAMGAPRVVYVSCDPGTLARDLGIMSGSGYSVEEVQPVDMFPWTRHVECVAKICR